MPNKSIRWLWKSLLVFVKARERFSMKNYRLFNIENGTLIECWVTIQLTQTSANWLLPFQMFLWKKIFNFTRLGHEDAKADFATVPLNSETYWEKFQVLNFEVIWIANVASAQSTLPVCFLFLKQLI